MQRDAFFITSVVRESELNPVMVTIAVDDFTAILSAGSSVSDEKRMTG